MTPTEEIQLILAKTLATFNQIPEQEWQKKDAPEKWSKKEILGHLIDSALTNQRRFIMSQYAQNQKIIYHQNEWVALQNYQQAEIKDLIELWKLLNQQIIRIIHHIPEVKIKNTCDTGKNSTQLHTLEFLITDYVKHMQHHLRQIVE